MLPEMKGANIAQNILGRYMAVNKMRDMAQDRDELDDRNHNALAMYGGPTNAAAAYADGMTPEAIAAMEALQEAWDKPLSINSAYRDPEHNERVGGAKNSQHTHGNAYDVDVSSMSPEEVIDLLVKAQESGFRGIGVYDNSLHFDVGPTRAWGPSYKRESLPAWAIPYVG